MKLESLRWILLPSAAVALLVIWLRGLSAERAVVFLVCAGAWYGLSRRKAYSLDRDWMGRRDGR